MNEHIIHKYVTKARGFLLCVVFVCAMLIGHTGLQAQLMVPQPGSGGGAEPKPAAAESKPIVRAEEPAPAADKDDEAVEELPIEERLRDPFWPVGYTPVRRVKKTKDGQPVKPVDIKPAWDEAEKLLNTAGLVIDESGKKEPFAIVNGNVVTIGDRLTLQSRKFVYFWTVKDITKKEGLQLTRKRAALKDK